MSTPPEADAPTAADAAPGAGAAAGDGPPLIRTRPSRCCVCGSDERVTVGRGIDFEYATCSNEWEFVRCAVCGHHYLFPFPDPSELGTIYPPDYANYSNSEKPSLAFRVKAMMEGRVLRKLAAGLPQGAAALDVGCGDGRLLDGIARACPQVTELAGVEISDAAAEQARAKGYQVSVGSFEDLEPPHERYDLIFLIQVLEHLFEPVATLERLHELLSPGGTLLLETPSTDCADFRRYKDRYWGGYHIPRHLNLFTAEPLERLLRDRGFEVVSVGHKLQPVHWIWSLHHQYMERGYPSWWVDRFHLKNPLLLALFSAVEASRLALGKATSNVQIVAKRMG